MTRAVWTLVLTAGVLTATQSAPQFVWRGKVDGVVELHIRGKRVTAEATSGGSPTVYRSKLAAALPDSNQLVELRVVEGRGSVRVTQQPRLENNYEAVLTFEDPQEGAGEYSIELRWSADRGSYDPEPKLWNTRDPFHHLTWSGRVDGSVIVECRDRSCTAREQAGAAPTRVKAKFSGPLPAREIRPSLDETAGRGTIRILEQPSAQNGYAVRILITDDRPGSDVYSFVLSWPR